MVSSVLVVTYSKRVLTMKNMISGIALTKRDSGNSCFAEALNTFAA